MWKPTLGQFIPWMRESKNDEGLTCFCFFRRAPFSTIILDIIWLPTKTLQLLQQILPPLADSVPFYCSLVSLMWTPTGHSSELQTFIWILWSPLCIQTLCILPHPTLWVTTVSQSCKFIQICVSCVIFAPLIKHWLIHSS